MLRTKQSRYNFTAEFKIPSHSILRTEKEKEKPLVFLFAQGAKATVSFVNRVFVFRTSISAMVRWTALQEKTRLAAKVI